VTSPIKFTRRAALAGLSVKAERPIAGGFVFESENAGHAIRDRRMPLPAGPPQKKHTVIVGGGIGGLSAGWWLRRQGFTDFVLLEMESSAGGNSRSGGNDVSRYPWAAHYVPVPNKESVYVRELFTELGLLVDGEWDERWLCHTPRERLFLHGRWQDGIEPELGLTAEDHRQFRAFAGRIAELRATRQFTIPMAIGAPAQSPLDTLSFKDWLRRNGFTSPYLHWLVDYSTRDDFGAAASETSAWAGIHYFAAREAEENGPLTWPEGNGWIASRLIGKLAGHIQTGEPAIHIAKAGVKWRVHTPKRTWEADRVIYAAPAYLLPYLDPTVPPVREMQWSPWLVANLTLDRLPAEKGLEPAWDNVIYGSPSLGYVVATHQSVRTHIDKTVWTYYYALAGRDPKTARHELLSTDWGTWRERILDDLSRAHKDIRACVSRIDIFRNGHAMVRPSPGFLSNPARLGWVRGRERFHYASADASGFSLFEEAQYRGILAAGKA